MNTPMKKLLIFGLCGGLGDILIDTTASDDVYQHARRLKILSDRAIKTAHVKLTPNMLKRIWSKIADVYTPGTDVDTVEVLSLCILGLMDLQHHSGPGTPVDSLLAHVMYFTKQFDPELQDEEKHSAATRKYLEWLE